MSIKQVSVFLENRPGTLNEMTTALAAGNIDMRALSLAEAGEFGIARIIVDELDSAVEMLKAEEYIYTITKVLGVAIPDEPGGLNRVLKILNQTGVNIEYMYATLGGADGHANMIFRVADVKAAEVVLKARGLKPLTQEQISGC